MNKKLIYIVVILIGFASNSQQPVAAETLAKVEAYYKANKILNLEIVYAMYKGYTGTYLTESYKSSMYKNNKTTKLKVLGSEIIQFPEAQLTINDESKTISYNVMPNDNFQKAPTDTSALLNFYKEVSTQVTNNTIIHELVLKNRQAPIPYGKIIIHINKSDYSIKKQVLYLSAKVPFVDKNGENTEDVGRMVITFKTKPKPTKVPQLQDYVLLDANKKPHVSQNYASYTIIDQTNL